MLAFFNVVASNFSVLNPEGVKIVYSATSDSTAEIAGCFNCDNYTKVTFPDTIKKDERTYVVTSVGSEALKNSHSQIFSLPSTLKVISSYAFHGSLNTEINLSESVDSIGDYAFASCCSLQKFSLPKSVRKLGIGVMADDTSLENISLPPSLKILPELTFFCCFNLKSVFLSDSIEEIGNNVFNVCPKIKTIAFPRLLRKLDKYAISGCNSLTSVILYDSIKTIEADAIFNCNSIDSVVCYATNPPVLGSPSTLLSRTSLLISVPCSSIEAYKKTNVWNTAFAINPIEANCRADVNEVFLNDLKIHIGKGTIFSSSYPFVVYDLNGNKVAEGMRVNNLQTGIYVVYVAYNSFKALVP